MLIADTGCYNSEQCRYSHNCVHGCIIHNKLGTDIPAECVVIIVVSNTVSTGIISLITIHNNIAWLTTAAMGCNVLIPNNIVTVINRPCRYSYNLGHVSI